MTLNGWLPSAEAVIVGPTSSHFSSPAVVVAEANENEDRDADPDQPVARAPCKDPRNRRSLQSTSGGRMSPLALGLTAVGTKR